jgi:hypothetical protein
MARPDRELRLHGLIVASIVVQAAEQTARPLRRAGGRVRLGIAVNKSAKSLNVWMQICGAASTCATWPVLSAPRPDPDASLTQPGFEPLCILFQ